ncbi:hypothetical protein D3C84_836530 [compost metagenome]
MLHEPAEHDRFGRRFFLIGHLLHESGRFLDGFRRIRDSAACELPFGKRAPSLNLNVIHLAIFENAIGEINAGTYLLVDQNALLNPVDACQAHFQLVHDKWLRQ